MPSKKPLTEKQIEQRVIDYAAHNKVLVFKFTPAGQRGWPDRLFLFDGRAMFIEFKRPGEQPTPLQGARLNCLRASGVAAHWCCYVTTGKFIVDELINGPTVAGRRKK